MFCKVHINHNKNCVSERWGGYTRRRGERKSERVRKEKRKKGKWKRNRGRKEEEKKRRKGIKKSEQETERKDKKEREQGGAERRRKTDICFINCRQYILVYESKWSLLRKGTLHHASQGAVALQISVLHDHFWVLQIYREWRTERGDCCYYYCRILAFLMSYKSSCSLNSPAHSWNYFITADKYKMLMELHCYFRTIKQQ